MPYNIRCNLVDDLNENAKAALENHGYRWAKSHVLSPFQQYLNILRREVHPQPRRVHKAAAFTCPAEHQDGLATLLKRIEQGHNVNAYLSSNLLDASYTDGFLSDFGFHHFHLGKKTLTSGKSKGFVQRTGPVLIALVGEHNFYCIAVKSHGRTGDSLLWARHELIETVHNNWPSLLEPYKVKNAIRLATKVTEEERKKLRNSQVNAPIEMSDGTSYFSPGGGITSAATGLNVTLVADKCIDHYRRLLQGLITFIRNEDLSGFKFPIVLKLVNLGEQAVFEDALNGYRYVVREIVKQKVQIVTIRENKQYFFQPVGYYNHKNQHAMAESSCAMAATRNAILSGLLYQAALNKSQQQVKKSPKR